MAGLYHTLNVGAEALYANRQGVDTAGHNIANAQTEGYSRQRVNLGQRDPSDTRGVLIGNGVYAQSITRHHDKFIERQMNLVTQDSSRSSAREAATKPIEQIYSTELTASISDELTNFFNAMQALSVNPSEQPTRTMVREAGVSLAQAFNRVDFNLERQQMSLDEQLNGAASDASDLCRQIASLNVSIQTMEAGRADQANDMRDQQDRLVRQLSEKFEISTYQNEHGALCVRGPNQSLLVDGKFSARIEVMKDEADGLSRVLVFDNEGSAHAKNVTDMIEKGEMGAIIDVRDRLIPQLRSQNNQLAYQLVENVNAVHRQGFGVVDYREVTGRNFFESVDPDRAARDIKLDDLIASDVNSIAAAATPNAPGDNVIANEILRLRTKPIMDDGAMSFTEFYSNYVGMLGLDIERTSHLAEADKVALADISSRREAVAGVSLDEEAVSLLKWQTAFAASSKLITTADEMLETVLSLKR